MDPTGDHPHRGHTGRDHTGRDRTDGAHTDGDRADPLEVMEELAAKLAGADRSGLSGEGLMDATARLQRVRDMVAVAEADLLARLEETAATDTAVGLVTGSWLCRTAEQPLQQSRVKVRRCETLARHFPFLADVVVSGWLSWAQAEVILAATNPRNREAMVESCAEFIRWANQAATEGGYAGRFERWAAKVRQRARELDADGGYDPNDDVHANRLRVSVLPDATREVTGRLVGSAGVTVTETLEAIAEELHRGWRQAANEDPSVEVPSGPTLMALALEEACRRATRRPAGSSAPARPEVVLVVEADQQGHATVTTAGGDPVPRSAADALLWDADVRALVVDQHRTPLWLGRSVRLATRDQRLALAVRDRGCIFPGCDLGPARSRAHHHPAWEHGGPTDIDHLAPLCARHHGVVHRTGWSQEPDPGRPQQWTVTTPDGRRLGTERNTP